MPRTRALGRLPSPPDPRDRQYAARTRYGAAVEAPWRAHQKWYSDALTYDQGRVGCCTMASAAGLLAAGPVTQRPYFSTAPDLDLLAGYCRAQEMDRMAYAQYSEYTGPTFCEDGRRPGGRGDTGATMRSAAQVLRELGYVSSFWWLDTVEDLLAYLTNVGPVWLGTVWYEGMDGPDADGFLRPTGAVVGGHAYFLDEVAHRSEYVWLKNSWSAEWGHRGRAKITFRDLERLLSEDGEALALHEIRPEDIVA